MGISNIPDAAPSVPLELPRLTEPAASALLIVVPFESVTTTLKRVPLSEVVLPGIV